MGWAGTPVQDLERGCNPPVVRLSANIRLWVEFGHKRIFVERLSVCLFPSPPSHACGGRVGDLSPYPQTCREEIRLSSSYVTLGGCWAQWCDVTHACKIKRQKVMVGWLLWGQRPGCPEQTLPTGERIQQYLSRTRRDPCGEERAGSEVGRTAARESLNCCHKSSKRTDFQNSRSWGGPESDLQRKTHCSHHRESGPVCQGGPQRTRRSAHGDSSAWV